MKKQQTEGQEPHEDQLQLPGFAVVQHPYTGRREVVMDPTGGMFDLVSDPEDEPEKES